jgi:hypothetical protein
MANEYDKKIRLTDDEKQRIDELNRSGESVLSIAGYLNIPPDAVRNHLGKTTKDRASKLPTAVFFIGLALTMLPISPIHFWPGILFVFAAVALTTGLTKGRLQSELKSAAWLTGIGLVFLLNFSLPLLLILIGLGSLFSFFTRPTAEQSEKKAEEKARRRREMRAGLREAGQKIREGIWGDSDDEYEYAKRKNDERRAPEADAYEKPKRGTMRLSDDGELIDIVDEGEAYQRRN